jgi:hypothetical protein
MNLMDTGSILIFEKFEFFRSEGWLDQDFNRVFLRLEYDSVRDWGREGVRE